MKNIKLAIVGSRDFLDYVFCKDFILSKFKVENIEEIVSGGARGADSLGERFAKEFNIKFTCFKPDWDTYGKRAGFLRNTTIVENSNTVIAFWVNKSNGTKDTISKAINSKSKVFVVNIEDVTTIEEYN